MRNALAYANMPKRNVTITLMLLTRFGHIPKLLIREVTSVLMTDKIRLHLSVRTNSLTQGLRLSRSDLTRVAAPRFTSLYQQLRGLPVIL